MANKKTKKKPTAKVAAPWMVPEQSTPGDYAPPGDVGMMPGPMGAGMPTLPPKPTRPTISAKAMAKKNPVVATKKKTKKGKK